MMRGCLDTFCNLSGQQISFPKSCIFCSSNTNVRITKDISKVCGSPLTKDLGKYLGVPLIHGRVRNRTYGALVEKVQSRLAAWKSDNLSVAGRVTLIKAVTSALPVYTMQSVKLPSELCLKLDKLNRNFLWGHTENKKATHLIKWDMVCSPKSRGGLGIKKMKGMNQALLAKVGWWILQHDNGIWCHLLNHKYLNNRSLTDPELIKGVVCSSTWRGVAFGAKLLTKGLRWRIGDGCQVLFWLDNWVPEIGFLREHATVIPSADTLTQTVSHFLCNGNWNIAQLAAVLPWNIVHRVVSIHAGGSYSGPDRCIWGWAKDGEFSVKTAHEGQLEVESLTLWPWKFVWKLKIPPRIQHFLWVLLHGKILTNEQRCIRGMGLDASCPRCLSGIENIEHLLRGYRDSKAVWEDISKGITSSPTFLGNMDDWLTSNLHNNKLVIGNVPSFLHFASVLWYIWKWRCSKTFDDDFCLPQTPHLIINRVCKDWMEANCAGNPRIARAISVAWDPPSEGYVKLNVDGGCAGGLGAITAGGVLRDHWKNWLGGFVVRKGVGSAIEAEFWGLFEGLGMAWRKGFRKIVVETDSMSVLQLIDKESTNNHPLFSILQSCKSLISKDWICSVKHVFREGNMVADGLAKMGHGLDMGVHFFEEPPPAITDIFLNDVKGLSSVRVSCC
ncbi:hypothetical protein LWI29_027305 [Acer saccharum]|uniref:RNase H type-1 domain-containing protein n=1 Tax=Acer saccharum TaxID=4024 RepID=A0AA39S9C2_ACESA|nr:hypothetical protein LWI29_027305 [Acer saccharum]